MNRLFRLAAVLVAAMVVSRANATPLDDITRAAVISGVEKGSDGFLAAFVAVLAHVKTRRVPEYVTAAITLRPDLQMQIFGAAFGANRSANSRVRQAQINAVARSLDAGRNSAARRRSAALQMLALRSGLSNDTPEASDSAYGENRVPRGKDRRGSDDDDNDVRSPEKPPRGS